MTKEEYQEQLLDDRWSKKRVKILTRDSYKCRQCGYDKYLEVHHLYYVEGHRAWEYPNDALITWCVECHSKWHEEHDIVVRKSVFSKGKKKKYIPPVKQKKSKKVKLEVLDPKFIPPATQRVIERGLKGLSVEEKNKWIRKFNKLYRREVSRSKNVKSK